MLEGAELFLRFLAGESDPDDYRAVSKKVRMITSFFGSVYSSIEKEKILKFVKKIHS